MKQYNAFNSPRRFKKAGPEYQLDGPYTYEELSTPKKRFATTETVAEYLERGGVITRIPSFEKPVYAPTTEALEKLLKQLEQAHGRKGI